MAENQDTYNSEELSESIPIADRIRKTWGSFITWVWIAPDPDEHIFLNVLKAFLRIHFIVIRECKRDRITLRASALTFTIVLSLVPVLALGTAVLKGLGAGDQMRQATYRFIDQLEEGPVPIGGLDQQGGPVSKPSSESTSVDVPAGADRADEISLDDSLTSHLRKAVDQIFDYVNRTNFAALGAFGIVGLILAVLTVLGSIEQAMNTIWQTESGRPLGRKLMDYLALMILLPIAINLALATETTLHSPTLLAYFQDILPVLWLGRLLLKMLPMFAVVATFTILYRFVPNIKVGFFPALAGGMFGGIGWLLVQLVYIKLQIGVARYNAIYGSFATLPLLLMWLYIGWVVFLAGAETAFAAQVWRDYNWKHMALTPIAKLAIAYDIIGAILADFHDRKTTDPASLSRQLKQPTASINEVITDLYNGGILRRIDGETIGYVPAAPEEEINPAEVIDLILGSNVPPLSGGSLAEEALNAARASLADKKIVCAACTKSSETEKKSGS